MLFVHPGFRFLCIHASHASFNVSGKKSSMWFFDRKLRASRMGYFSKDEWRQGLKALRVDSLDKLKRVLPTLQDEVCFLAPVSFVWHRADVRSCLILFVQLSATRKVQTIICISLITLCDCLRPVPKSISLYFPEVVWCHCTLGVTLANCRFCFQVANPYTFKDFYQFAFGFCLTGEHRKAPLVHWL
jgi:hypothetical protein